MYSIDYLHLDGKIMLTMHTGPRSMRILVLAPAHMYLIELGVCLQNSLTNTKLLHDSIQN